jgi:hypothetical protein
MQDDKNSTKMMLLIALVFITGVLIVLLSNINSRGSIIISKRKNILAINYRQN